MQRVADGREAELAGRTKVMSDAAGCDSGAQSKTRRPLVCSLEKKKPSGAESDPPSHLHRRQCKRKRRPCQKVLRRQDRLPSWCAASSRRRLVLRAVGLLAFSKLRARRCLPAPQVLGVCRHLQIRTSLHHVPPRCRRQQRSTGASDAACATTHDDGHCPQPFPERCRRRQPPAGFGRERFTVPSLDHLGSLP